VRHALAGKLTSDIRPRFLTGFRAFVADADALKAVMAPIVHEHARMGVLADSLVKVLLGVDSIQTEVVTVLLEKMCEQFMDADHASYVRVDTNT